MKGLLIIGGGGPQPTLFTECREDATIVVAADSGLEKAIELGMTPDYVVGDMDSLKDRHLLDSFNPERVMIFPTDKDETDTEIGLRMLEEKGCSEVVIGGGGGGRLDHILGIVMLFERDRPPRRWITENEDIRLVDGEIELVDLKGALVSFFPLGTEAAELASEGLKWPLDGLVFRRGYAGISNLVTDDTARVRVGRGRILMVRSFAGVGVC